VNQEATLVNFTDTIATPIAATIIDIPVVVLKDNLIDRISQRAQLSQFAHALKASALDSVLKVEEGPFTVFAVLNEQEIAAAKQSSTQKSETWPASYIVKGAYSTPDIYKGFSSLMPQTTFKTYDQKQITIYSLRDTLFFKFNAEKRTAYLYASDLYASNGVVHIIKFLAD